MHILRQSIWLVLVALGGCVAVVANYYQPQDTGDVEQVWGACSMAPRLQITRHLAAGVDVVVSPLAKSDGIEHAALSVSLQVPDGTTVRLTSSAITVREGAGAPAITLMVDRIRKPRTIVKGQVSDYLGPGDALTGPAGYGIGVDLPHNNPAHLIITPPPLDINGQHVDIEPMEFTLKTRPHVTGFC
jgi:hypothetical protein